MKIGVLSDTHSLILPASMLEAFQKVDLIIHAGDLCDMHTLKQLQAIKPLKAVHGNMCDPAVARKLPVRDIVEVGGIKIGITHGHIGVTRNAETNAQAQFKDDHVDMVIFGHSHQALNEKTHKTILFNPGSPNDVIKAKFFSYGLIHIKDGHIKAEIIKI